MRKLRADAKWNELSDEQRKLLEEWLFDERITYAAALTRAKKEFGFKGSVSSVRRFYEHAAQERTIRNLGASQAEVEKITGTAVSTEGLRAAGMKVMAQLFLNGVVQSPDKIKDWSKLAKLLLQEESHEIRVRLKREENELRRRKLEFEREKFHYNVMEEGQKALPELQRLAEAGLSKYERNKRRNALRRRMFGPNIPELLPENEAEEEQMAKQKVIDDAEWAKHNEWWQKKFGHLQGSWRKTREQSLAEARALPEPEDLEETNASDATDGKDGTDASETPEPPKEPEQVVERGVVYPFGQ